MKRAPLLHVHVCGTGAPSTPAGAPIQASPIRTSPRKKVYAKLSDLPRYRHRIVDAIKANPGKRHKALSKELGQEWSDAQTDEVMTEMDTDGGGTVDAKELRSWLEEYEAGGGGLLGVTLRQELDKVLEIGAALDDEIAAFLSSDESDDGDDGDEPQALDGAARPGEQGEKEVAADEEFFVNKPMRVSRRVIPGEEPQ